MAGETKSSQQADQGTGQFLYLPTNGKGDPGSGDRKLFDVETTRPSTIVKRDGRVEAFDGKEWWRVCAMNAIREWMSSFSAPA